MSAATTPKRRGLATLAGVHAMVRPACQTCVLNTVTARATREPERQEEVLDTQIDKSGPCHASQHTAVLAWRQVERQLMSQLTTEALTAA